MFHVGRLGLNKGIFYTRPTESGPWDGTMGRSPVFLHVSRGPMAGEYCKYSLPWDAEHETNRGGWAGGRGLEGGRNG